MKSIILGLLALTFGLTCLAANPDADEESKTLLKYRMQYCFHPDDERASSPPTIVTCNGRTIGYGMRRIGADESRCMACEARHPEGGCVIKKIHCSVADKADKLGQPGYRPYTPRVFSLRKQSGSLSAN